MTFNCALQVSGISPKKSQQAFIQSYIDTSSPKYYKAHNKRIENFFKEKVRQNMSQSQIPNSLNKTFFINFKSDGIYFSSNSSTALKYEFGSGNTPPKRFIEPAFIETANEISQIMISDAIDSYNRYVRFI